MGTIIGYLSVNNMNPFITIFFTPSINNDLFDLIVAYSNFPLKSSKQKLHFFRVYTFFLTKDVEPYFFGDSVIKPQTKYFKIAV